MNPVPRERNHKKPQIRKSLHSSSGGPQDHSCVWRFSGTQGTWYIVVPLAKIYCSAVVRIHNWLISEKGTYEVCRNSWTGFITLSREKIPQSTLFSQQQKCGNTYERFSAQGQRLVTWCCRHPLPSTQDPRLQEGKHKPHYLHRQPKHSKPLLSVRERREHFQNLNCQMLTKDQHCKQALLKIAASGLLC